MKLISTQFQSMIEFEEGKFNSIIIEAPDVFREVVREFVSAINGLETGLVLSENNVPIKISQIVELIMTYIPFEVNTKKLMTNLAGVLEKEAMNEENYLHTQELLAEIENYLDKLSFRLPANLEYKISASGLIKMAAPKLSLEGASGIEEIFDYMQFCREVIGERLFVFVNLRAYYTDKDVEKFTNTCLAHKFSVLLIDSKEFPCLSCEKRLLIDIDRCEI